MYAMLITSIWKKRMEFWVPTRFTRRRKPPTETGLPMEGMGLFFDQRWRGATPKIWNHQYPLPKVAWIIVKYGTSLPASPSQTPHRNLLLLTVPSCRALNSMITLETRGLPRFLVIVFQGCKPWRFRSLSGGAALSSQFGNCPVKIRGRSRIQRQRRWRWSVHSVCIKPQKLMEIDVKRFQLLRPKMPQGFEIWNEGGKTYKDSSWGACEVFGRVTKLGFAC